MILKKTLLVLLALGLAVVARADYYVATAANGGVDEDNDVGDAEHPFLTIAKGVSKADAGETVHVGAGTFEISATISIAKGVSVVGAGRDQTTVKPVTTCVRGFSLNHASAELACLTVTGFSGTGNDYGGMGVLIGANGGLVRDCTIAGNSDKSGYHNSRGAGLMLSAGKVLRTVISGNTTGGTQYSAQHLGGGVYISGGTLESCLICSNSTSRSGSVCQGGGVYMTGGSLVNCTVADNTSLGGGSVYVASGSPTIVNTVIEHNSATSGDPDLIVCDGYDTTLIRHCATYQLFGSDPVADVRFADRSKGDYTLPGGSAGFDAGLVSGVTFESDTDLAGKPRLTSGKVDVGCYQYDRSVTSVGIALSKTKTRRGDELTLAAVGYALPDGAKTYEWTITLPDATTVTPTGGEIQFSPTLYGFHAVRVIVKDADGNELARLTREKCFYHAEPSCYVALGGSDDDNTGLASDDAFATIEKGVLTAKAQAVEANEVEYYAPTNQAVVHVGAGEFTITTQVVLDAPVVVSGEGETKTFVTATKNLRAFSLTKPLAALENLTVWNCLWDSVGYVQHTGMCVSMSQGTIRRCTLCNNTSGRYNSYGAGVYMAGGLVDHCVITNNSSTGGNRQGGGVWASGGRVENSLVAANLLGTGGTGGGVYVDSGTPTFLNCTIAGNTGKTGAGVYVKAGSPNFINCIVANNRYQSAASDFIYYGTYDTNLVDHCAIPDFAFGESTASGAIDLKADYSPNASSSAVDAGRDDQTYASPGDLAGNARKSGAHVDAGCYEYDISGYAASFTLSPATVLTGESVTLTPTVTGASDESTLTYAWTVTNNLGVVSNYTDRIVTTAFDIGGTYTVLLTVTDVQKGPTSAVKKDSLNVVATARYVATAAAGGDDANHGQTADKPFLSVNKAVTEARTAAQSAGVVVTVHVGAGTFVLTDGLTLDQAVRVAGAGRDLTFFEMDKNSVKRRFFYVNHASAEVADLTARDFTCYSTGEYDGVGTYIGSAGGLVRDCAFDRISAGGTPHAKGAGAYLTAGRLLRCRVNGCTTANNMTEGAGVYMTGGVVESCFIVSNRFTRSESSNRHGGGVYMTGGTLLNTTVADNSACNGGGGVYATGDATRLVNCVIADNASSSGEADFGYDDTVEAENLVNSYLGGLSVGTGTVLKDVDFVKDGHALRASSRCIDAGTQDGVELSATDYAGRARVSGAQVDLGCFEYDQSVFSCGLKADSAQVFSASAFHLVPTVFAPPAGANLTYAWTVTDGTTVRQYATAEVNDTIGSPGSYSIELVVTDEVSGKSVRETREGYLYIVSLDRYVAPDGSDANDGLDAAHPYGTLTNGVAKISEVAENSGMHATLHLAAGTYVISNTLSLAASVGVVGAGRDTTFVTGGVNIDTAFSLSHHGAVLSSLTVTNVTAKGYDKGGVGVSMSRGLVTNVCITSCSATDWRGYGMGVYMTGGTVADSIVERCRHELSTRRGCGIWMSGGTVVRTLVRNNTFAKFANSIASGGGVYMEGGWLVNSSVVGNYTERLGGGVYATGSATVISNCLIAGNTAVEDDGDRAPNLCLEDSFRAANLANCFVGKLEDAFVDADAAPLAGSPLIAAKIGWKAYDTTQAGVGFATDRAEVLAGEAIAFTGSIYGGASGTCVWSIQPPEGEAIAAEGATFSKTFETPGVYGVTLTVAGVGSLSRAAAFRVGPKTIALTDGGDLAAAVAEAVDGTRITLGAGEYGLNGELVVDKDIDIVGAGRNRTVLRQTNATEGIRRALRLAGGGTLRRVAVTGGHITLTGNAYVNSDNYGAGVWITGRGGTVSDCRLFGNRFGGNNTQNGAGLALVSSKGRVTRTLIDGNRATASNSTGGGAYLSAGRMDSCLVLTNTAAMCGGVAFGAGGELVNCTISGNGSTASAGGVHLGVVGTPTIHNNVLAGNTSAAAGDFTGKPQWGACSGGYGNLTNAVKNCAFVASDHLGEDSFRCEDARFRDAANGDYHITGSSPLRAAGRYEGAWMDAASDYYGNARVGSRQRVDVGCHQTPANATLLIIR